MQVWPIVSDEWCDHHDYALKSHGTRKMKHANMVITKSEGDQIQWQGNIYIHKLS